MSCIITLVFPVRHTVSILASYQGWNNIIVVDATSVLHVLVLFFSCSSHLMNKISSVGNHGNSMATASYDVYHHT